MWVRTMIGSVYSLNIKRVERVEINSKRSEGSETQDNPFRVENFHPKLSVKVKLSLSKEWNIDIKKSSFTPFRVFPPLKHVLSCV